jgi:beta-galactosidase/beta-glucuronidase
MTRWAKEIDPKNPWPEYPRPQMVRDEWQNLNGLWDYAIRPSSQEKRPTEYLGQILVPYPIESSLSGVKQPVKSDQRLWYHREFTLPGSWLGKRVLLHFEAVDWKAEVWVNNWYVGSHQGGYDPFTFDITNHLNTYPLHERSQKIEVAVTDPTNKGTQPRGKQVLEPGGIWYTAVTGIWQTVWLEPVNPSYIRDIKLTPSIRGKDIRIEFDIENAPLGAWLQYELHEPGGHSPSYTPIGGIGNNRATSMKRDSKSLVGHPSLIIGEPILWTPDNPHLYPLKIALLDAQKNVLDKVETYAAFREIKVRKDDAGINRLFLNGKPLFQYGPLDQGWWPDGLYTPPTDEAMVYDLQMLKELGMNMLRKHVKIESRRYYHHCDKMGLLVWQDMPSGDQYIARDQPDIQRSEESAKQFEVELREMIDTLYNHPSIVMWVIYNEGWGQWDTPRITEWVNGYDGTRLVNAVSGWADRGVGDVIDMHSYPGPGMFPAEEARASVLGEFGGMGWPVAEHLWQERENWGYRTYQSREELQSEYEGLLARLPALIADGLAAAVYTQTTDVEGEVNGLMTYDRQVRKLDVSRTRPLHETLIEPLPSSSILPRP